MRAACLWALFLGTAWIPAPAAGEEPAKYAFVKFGGEIRSDGRVVSARTDLTEPLTILEEDGDRARVSLPSGSAGWIKKSEFGTLDEVLKDASQQIANRPDDVELRLFRVELSARRNARGDRERALADLAHVVELAPKEPRPYLLRGSLWAKARRFNEAAQDFSRALALDGALSQALLERGLAHYGLRDFDAALSDLDAFVRLEPNAAMGFAARAMTRVELEQYDEAEADFARAMKLDGKLALPWFERARMWMRRHDAPQAVADLSETLKREPQHLDATIFLATLLACGPDDTPRDGKRAVELALAANKQTGGGDFRAIEALAAAHAEAGDFPRAIEHQEKALTMLNRSGAAEGAKAAARYRLSQYKASQPVRLMR